MQRAQPCLPYTTLPKGVYLVHADQANSCIRGEDLSSLAGYVTYSRAALLKKGTSCKGIIPYKQSPAVFRTFLLGPAYVLAGVAASNSPPPID
jgi:hypothetical protein